MGIRQKQRKKVADISSIANRRSTLPFGQDRDSRAFQLMLQVPDGGTFLGSTPELLYLRSGNQVASEAVAATRPRGPPGSAP